MMGKRGPMSEEHKRKISDSKKRYYAEKRANGGVKSVKAEDIARSEMVELAYKAIQAGDAELASVWLTAAAGIR